MVVSQTNSLRVDLSCLNAFPWFNKIVWLLARCKWKISIYTACFLYTPHTRPIIIRNAIDNNIVYQLPYIVPPSFTNLHTTVLDLQSFFLLYFYFFFVNLLFIVKICFEWHMKLLTKQGMIKSQTECAPNNGYFLIPLYDKVYLITWCVVPVCHMCLKKWDPSVKNQFRSAMLILVLNAI